jgi:membrane fusion protein (multidrug efflux system)
MKNKLNQYTFTGLFLIFLICFLYWFFVWRFQAYTTDTYVQGNMVAIKPLHSGFVTGIYTDDSYFVQKGQLLVTLNETDSLIALEKAKQKLARTVRDVCQSFHKVFMLFADINVKKAEHLKAKQNFHHRQGVIKVRGVSLEDYQNAMDDLNASAAALESTKSNFHKGLAFIEGTSIADHPWVQEAVQEVRDAWVHLYRCKIYAPTDGVVAQRTVQVGMWLSSEDVLMALIPLNQIWVNANFKETQLKNVRIGQPVKLTSDLYGRSIVFHGKIVGLPGAAGNAFALLPPENLSGNWIKIVQRLPVRVALEIEELKRHPLRIGLTMEATADLSDQSGAYVNTASARSPQYVTDIFLQEEHGAQELIAQIIAANIDPNLQEYAQNSFNFNKIQSDRK